MYLVYNSSTDSAHNLALEEYALTKMNRDIILLWRNHRAIIIGKNQNTIEEIDLNYVKARGINIIRRLSGGGAVFHDLGNINFTIIQNLDDGDFSNYEKFTSPICAFLQKLGVNARLQGRNDLVIDGMKFSGNAQAIKNGRIMHHGTILFKTDFTDLAKSLTPRNVKLSSKSVKSVRSRITNVASHLLVPMTVEDFLHGLYHYFLENVPNIEEYTFTQQDIDATAQLSKEKYSRWEWNFGKSPDYDYKKTEYFPFGIVDVWLKVSGGILKKVHIFGDFFGINDISALEQCLCGVRHNKDDILTVLRDTNIQQYIHGITLEQFTDLFSS